MVSIDTKFMILGRAAFAAPVGTTEIWAAEINFDGQGAVTAKMAEPHLVAVLWLVFTLAGAAAMMASAAMFAATSMAVFTPVR
jgi:hypothetical protein